MQIRKSGTSENPRTSILNLGSSERQASWLRSRLRHFMCSQNICAFGGRRAQTCIFNRSSDLYVVKMGSGYSPCSTGQQKTKAISWSLFGHFYGKFIEIICWKAPSNYSASFWTYRFSILWLEKPQTSICMISGFLGLVGTLIYKFLYAKILRTYNL